MTGNCEVPLSTPAITGERLRKLQLVSDAALAHLTLDDLLEELASRPRDVLEADTCAVMLLDDETDELVVRSVTGLAEAIERGLRIPIAGGFAGRVAAGRRPIAIESVGRADNLGVTLRERGIRSLVAAPLLVADRVLGVIEIGTLRQRRFTDEDQELLQLAADRAATGIDHARLFEAEHALAVGLRKLQSVTDAALAHLSLAELLDELLLRAREIFEADTCAVLLLDRATNELVARAAKGLEEEVERGVRIPVGRGFAGRIAAERRPIAIEDVDHADILNPILRKKGIRSLLDAPLLVGDRVIGVIHVGTLHHRSFAPEEADLLAFAAERAAMGVEKALVHDELIRLDRVRHQFVSIASHELRTPAAAILGAAETLERRRETLPEATSEQLRRIILEQSRRLASLLEQLLDVSKLEAQAIELRPRRLNVRERAERVTAELAIADRAAVSVGVPSELEIEADEIAFERIVGNLVLNAVRHGSPPITISALARERHLELFVEDRGRGVPLEFRDRMFEQFTRGPGSGGTPGAGLGLAIARSYARASGGDLLYEELAPRGARFRLVLPIADARGVGVSGETETGRA